MGSKVECIKTDVCENSAESGCGAVEDTVIFQKSDMTSGMKEEYLKLRKIREPATYSSIDSTGSDVLRNRT